MKKTIFCSFALIFGTVVSNAQSIPNAGFENWPNTGGYNVPEGWRNLNDMTASSGIWSEAIKGNTKLLFR